ncbi:hypothetical protein SRHO_G00331170 [Serrasalmus rhombeus]
MEYQDTKSGQTSFLCRGQWRWACLWTDYRIIAIEKGKSQAVIKGGQGKAGSPLNASLSRYESNPLFQTEDKNAHNSQARGLVGQRVRSGRIYELPARAAHSLAAPGALRALLRAAAAEGGQILARAGQRHGREREREEQREEHAGPGRHHKPLAQPDGHITPCHQREQKTAASDATKRSCRSARA